MDSEIRDARPFAGCLEGFADVPHPWPLASEPYVGFVGWKYILIDAEAGQALEGLDGFVDQRQALCPTIFDLGTYTCGALPFSSTSVHFRGRISPFLAPVV